MAKGMIFFIVVVVALVVITTTVRYLLIKFEEDRKTRAISRALWVTYSEPRGDQVIEVGVRKVASWGVHTDVLKNEKLVDVRINPYGVGDISLDEAKDAAKRLADTYNAEVR